MTDSDDYLRHLLESLGEGIYGVDGHGVCRYINQHGAEMLGYEPDELIGRHVHLMVHHSHPDGSPYAPEDCPVSHAYTEGLEIRVSDDTFWHKDGSPVLVEYAAFPVYDAQGTILGAATVYSRQESRDSQLRRRAIDERAQARDAVRDYQRALVDYTHLTRHRLVNPLTAITAGLETLYSLDLEVLDRETRCQIIGAMRDKAQELQRVMLDPSQLTEEELLVGLRPLLGATSEELFRIRAAETEMAFREQNWDHIARLEDHSGARPLQFVCECSANSCSTLLTVPLADYFRVHSRRDAFILLPGHEMLALERVVEEHDGWYVVHKIGEGEAATQARPHPGDDIDD